MDLTNIHKSFLLFFALCSFASFVLLFQFNTTNGVLAEVEVIQRVTEIIQRVPKFRLHYITGLRENPNLAISYDELCAGGDDNSTKTKLKKICHSREKLMDLITAASYVTLVFCISLFSGFFFVLEKNKLSLTSKSIGILLGFLYVADVVLYGVMFSENNSFYSAVKEGFATIEIPDQGQTWNQGQSMVYIGGSLICNLAIPGAILIYAIVYFIYSYCYKKNDGYSGVSTMSRAFK